MNTSLWAYLSRVLGFCIVCVSSSPHSLPFLYSSTRASFDVVLLDLLSHCSYVLTTPFLSIQFLCNLQYSIVCVSPMPPGHNFSSAVILAREYSNNCIVFDECVSSLPHLSHRTQQSFDDLIYAYSSWLQNVLMHVCRFGIKGL